MPSTMYIYVYEDQMSCCLAVLLKHQGIDMHLTPLQAALTKRITNRARLEEVARCVIANSTDKLFEVGLDEHKVSFAASSN